MRVPGDWTVLFSRTPVPLSGEADWRCNWCGWKARITLAAEHPPAHECPGPQPRPEGALGGLDRKCGPGTANVEPH